MSLSVRKIFTKLNNCISKNYATSISTQKIVHLNYLNGDGVEGIAVIGLQRPTAKNALKYSTVYFQ